jgi:FkbH-like protein
MSHSVSELPWLPIAPEDVATRLRALSAEVDDLGLKVCALANYRLPERQAAALGRAVKRLIDKGAKLHPLSGFRLGLLTNATFDLLVDLMPAAAARHGVALSISVTPYDQVAQQALDPMSTVNRESLDAVLIAVDHRWFGLDGSLHTESEARFVEAALSRLDAIVDAIRRHGGKPVILQTVPTPAIGLFGSYDASLSGTRRRIIAEINAGIVRMAEAADVYLLDIASLAERIGTDDWFDPVQWASYKLPFSARHNAIYADYLGRLLGTIRGKARKCLVLDLDNTLWGGVIGDDGLDGIKIGQGSALGEAFINVQQIALALRERGVVLAVASKNDDATAREPFRGHVEMLLKEKHIAVFQANWLDKASNLEAIAKALNIGLDALVFLDDNAAERAQMRAALPAVAVPELPADPNWYPWYLMSAGYFEAVAFSAEDRGRAESYAAEARRAEVMETARDLGEYLTSLDMTFTASGFDAQGLKRITQLINKTNQFNLTTRRYKEAEVAQMSQDPETFTLQVRLQDRFGDFGMIGVVICKPLRDVGPSTWEIDTWLMSCRVLGRQVEQGMLDEVVRAARASRVEVLRGKFIPTPKNGMVADHFPKLGFTSRGQTPEGEFLFDLHVADYQGTVLPFRQTAGLSPQQVEAESRTAD